MKNNMSKKHLIIPDVQIRPGDDLRFLTAIGNFIIDKKPDVIIQIGDFTDMASLSSYDMGKKAFEGRRYKKDIEISKKAMQTLLAPLKSYNKRMSRLHRTRYKPQLVLTLGNHEDRITRAVESDAKLEDTIGVKDLEYEKFGWQVIPFLQPIVIDGISYCHFFPRSPSGKVTQTKRGAPSAVAQANREKMSCTSGHLQGLDVAMVAGGGGRIIRSIIAGSCYEHDEEYLSPQGNMHFRGILVKHRVKNGNYDLMEVSLDYLKENYL